MRLARARAETFKFYQFVRKLRLRFLACVFFSFSRIFFSVLPSFNRLNVPAFKGDFRYRFRTIIKFKTSSELVAIGRNCLKKSGSSAS